MAISARGPFLVVFLVLVLSVGTLVWLLQRPSQNPGPIAPPINRPEQPINSPGPSVASQPSPLASPSPESTPTAPSPQVVATVVPPPPVSAEEPQPQLPATTEPGYVGKLNLIIPVSGVKPAQLQDTFS